MLGLSSTFIFNIILKNNNIQFVFRETCTVFDLVGYFFISLSLSAICRKGKGKKKCNRCFGVGFCHPSHSAIHLRWRERDNSSIVHATPFTTSPPFFFFFLRRCVEAARMRFSIMMRNAPFSSIVFNRRSFENCVIGTDCCVVCQVTTTHTSLVHERRANGFLNARFYQISLRFFFFFNMYTRRF